MTHREMCFALSTRPSRRILALTLVYGACASVVSAAAGTAERRSLKGDETAVRHPRAAGILIDSFNDPGPALSYTNGASDLGSATGAGILGAERDVVILGTSNESASAVISDGLLEYEVTFGNATQPDHFVFWDVSGDNIADVDPTGLGGRNLAAGGATAFHVLGVTTTRETLLFISVFELEGNIGFGQVVVPAGTTNGDFVLPFASFTASPNTPDFGNIGAVALNIGFSDVTVPASVRISEVNTIGFPTAVEAENWNRIKALFR